MCRPYSIHQLWSNEDTGDDFMSAKSAALLFSLFYAVFVRILSRVVSLLGCNCAFSREREREREREWVMLGLVENVIWHTAFPRGLSLVVHYRHTIFTNRLTNATSMQNDRGFSNRLSDYWLHYSTPSLDVTKCTWQHHCHPYKCNLTLQTLQQSFQPQTVGNSLYTAVSLSQMLDNF